MKQCSECKKLGAGPKPRSEFNASKKAPDGLQNWCRACHKTRHAGNKTEIAARNKAWREAHPELTREHGRKHRAKLTWMQRVVKHLKTTYGISACRYSEMFERQQGLCAICSARMMSQLSSKTTRSKLQVGHVDHCHKTGSIRGLLCHICNVGLGKFRDDEKILLNAARYLRESATAIGVNRPQHDTLQGKPEPLSRDLGSSTSRGRRQQALHPYLN